MVNPTSSRERRGGLTPLSDLKPSVILFFVLFILLASFLQA